jgi:lipid-A-disaccharide synthase
MKRLFVLAGEASGDLYGGAFIRALKARVPDLEVRGWGGEEMERAGATVTRHFRELNFMGFAEVVRHLPTILRNLREARREVLAFRPDAFLGVDFPGFNVRLEGALRGEGIRIHHAISPAIWAWRPGRIHTLARTVDRMHVILPFEAELYTAAGIDVRFIGHPLLDLPTPPPLAADLLPGVPPEAPLLALLPGSRAQELHRMLPVLLGAAAAVRATRPDVQAVVAAAPGADPDHYAPARAAGIPVVHGATRSLLAHSRAALVTSGTATLETALFGTPSLIGYRTSPLTYAIARRLARVDHIGLPNLILGTSAVPEFIQHDCTAAALARHVLPLLDPDAPERRTQCESLVRLRSLLGGPGAAERLADSLLETP